MGLTVIPPGGGEVVGDKPGRRVEILSDRDPVHATLSRFGPGMEGADLHVHQHHTDFFYVLEGELTVRLGAEDRQVRGARGLARVGAAGRRPRLPQRERRRHALPELPRARVPASPTTCARCATASRSSTTSTTRPPTAAARPRRRTSRRARRSPRASTLLADLAVLRVTRERGATEPRRIHGLSSYFALEGDLVLTHGAEEVFAPAGSWVQVPAGHEHAVDGLFLNVTAPSSTA